MQLSADVVKQMSVRRAKKWPANSRLDKPANLDDSARLKIMKYILLIGGIVLTAQLAQSQPVAPAPSAGFSGKVLETTNAAGYTYVLVDTGAKKVWAATTQFEVKPGQSVSFGGGEPMVNFHSKSMNRDFPEIYFTGAITVKGLASAAQLPPNHPPIGGVAGKELPPNHPPIAGKAEKPKLDFSKLKPAKDGKTVAEIYAKQAKLNGKAVVIRGIVVKFNADIMGKNWIHIQDGTGQPGSDDLLATSGSTVKVGDTILVTGKIATKKDFGSGYKYDVILDAAKVVVE